MPRDSLSVVIPVHNGQSILTLAVGRILDVMPDLVGRFEVLIVDDGSNDGTEEAAWDLAARYTQVDYVRHPIPLGMAEAVRSGLEAVSGEYVLICEGSASMAVERMVAMWRQRSEIEPWDTVSDSGSAESDPPSNVRRNWLRRMAGRQASPSPTRPVDVRYDGLRLVHTRAMDRHEIAWPRQASRRAPGSIGHRFRLDRAAPAVPRRSLAVEVLRQKATSSGH